MDATLVRYPQIHVRQTHCRGVSRLWWYPQVLLDSSINQWVTRFPPDKIPPLYGFFNILLTVLFAMCWYWWAVSDGADGDDDDDSHVCDHRS